MSHSYSLWLFDHHAMIVLSRAGRPLLPVHDAFILDASDTTLQPIPILSDAQDAPHDDAPYASAYTRAILCDTACPRVHHFMGDLAC